MDIYVLHIRSDEWDEDIFEAYSSQKKAEEALLRYCQDRGAKFIDAYFEEEEHEEEEWQIEHCLLDQYG